jgi:hypothetical protein
MKAARRVRDLRPVPPTPSNRALPSGREVEGRDSERSEEGEEKLREDEEGEQRRVTTRLIHILLLKLLSEFPSYYISTSKHNAHVGHRTVLYNL